MAEGKAARAARLDLATLRAIPRGVWGVGLVSLFMDMSSEMIHALLPVYLVTVLGASALSVGLIEGVAEATASIVKVFSGALSDWFGRRKALAAWPRCQSRSFPLPATCCGSFLPASPTASARASAAPRAMP